MRLRSAILLTITLLAPTWRAADVAAAELGTAPHFLMLADRERVVLFSDGAIAGALADQRADGSIVVTVPKVAAGAAIAGREFDDSASGGTGRTKVRVTSDAQGDARIEIRAANPVSSVRAYATGKPPRLTIDLLKEGAQDAAADKGAKSAPGTTTSNATKTQPKAPPLAPADVKASQPTDPATTVAGKSAAPEGAAEPVAAQKEVAKPALAPAEAPAVQAKSTAAAAAAAAAAPPVEKLQPGALAQAKPAAASLAHVETAAAPLAQAKNEPAPVSDAHVADLAPATAGRDVAPAATDDTRDLPALATSAPAAAAQAPAASPTPAVSAKDKGKKKGKGAVAAAAAPTAAITAPVAAAASISAATAAANAVHPAAPETATPAIAQTAAETLVCRWRRVAGVPYCGPDPKAGIYAADLGTAEIAGLLDRGRSGATLVKLPDHGPAEAHLNADVALVHAAKSGYLLPVLAEYEQALRTYPNFADATRSRANVALIYHSLGFAPELARLSRAKNDVVAPFAAVLLADLWRDRSERHDLTPLLATGRSAGGITTCLAERVAANVAADQGRAAAFPAAFSDLSKVCPRTVLEDSETAWLRGRAMVLGGDAKRASEVLPLLEEEVPRRERPLLLADVVAAEDAAGDAKGARRTQERLAGGSLGRRAARDARLALAARDAVEGKVGDTTRFADMPLEDAVQSRERADVIAVGELLRSGKEIAALGMMTERRVDARSLAPADQLLLARALRKVGLLDQSRRVLAGIGAATTGRLPDGYYEEMGALALAHDDAPGALDVAEQWKAARVGNVPAGAIALKARARAAKGDAQGAIDALDKELVPLDPVLARDVAIELAAQLRSADPAVALRLAQGALADSALPPLDAVREAEALSALADAAEATGDKGAARVAFTRLARDYASEPAAAGAAYRAARLAAVAPSSPVSPTQQAAAKAPLAAPVADAAAPVADDDALSRRLAAAGQVYAEVVAGMQGTKP